MESLKRRAALAQLNELINTLRDRIHRGHLIPGQRLIEADVAAETGLNRARVREAFRLLEAEGLIEIHRNRGASIRRMSRQEVTNTFEVLGAIANLMAEKAVRRIKEEQARSLLNQSLRKVRAFRKKIGQIETSRQLMDENARFWDVFAALSDNPLLNETRLRIETSLFRLALEGARAGSANERWVPLHEEILLAVLAGDEEQVRHLVRDAVDAGLQVILALPDKVFAD